VNDPSASSSLSSSSGSLSGIKAPVPTFYSLATDDTLQAVYSLHVSPAEPKRVIFKITVYNKSSTAAAKRVTVDCTPTLNAKLVQTVAQIPSIEPGASIGDQIMSFQIENFTRAQTLVGSIKYVLSEGGNEVSKEIVATFGFPVSAFVLPVNVTVDDYARLASSGNMNLSKCVVDLRGKNVNDALQLLADKLHLFLVESISQGATFYGRTIQNHNVCVLGKERGGKIEVQIKTENSTFGDSLCAEIATIFQQ